MKTLSILLIALTTLVSGCVVYDRDGGHRGDHDHDGISHADHDHDGDHDRDDRHSDDSHRN